MLAIRRGGQARRLNFKAFDLRANAARNDPRRGARQAAPVVIPPQFLDLQPVALQKHAKLAREDPRHFKAIALAVHDAEFVEPRVMERHILRLPSQIALDAGGLIDRSIELRDVKTSRLKPFFLRAREDLKVGLENIEPESPVGLEMSPNGLQHSILLRERGERQKRVEEDRDPIELSSQIQFSHVAVDERQLAIR